MFRSWPLWLVGCGAVSPDPADAPIPTDPAFVPAGCVGVTAMPEATFLEDGVPTDGALDPCSSGLHAFAGAVGSTVELAWDGPDATLEILDLNGVLLHGEPLAAGDSVPHTLTWSGEHLLRVRPVDPDADVYTVTATCVADCAAYTRHPLFFMHGMGGTDTFLGGIDYWVGVRERLEGLGYAMHAPAVDPFQSSEVRAAQWAIELDALVATGQARRFNLIAHSQAGIDARYLAGVLDPDGRIASITTIGTPHAGTAVADLALGLLEIPGVTGALIDEMFDGLGTLFGSTNDQDILLQLEDLSTARMADFDATVPTRPDVLSSSWAGRTCGLVEIGCQSTNGGEVVKLMLSPSRIVLALAEGDNDGLVSVTSAQWGTFLGTLPADHLDEVGLLPGTQAPGYDHLGFYEAEADRLRSAGL